ncbi:MAG TPA: hypothetical protein DCX54_10810 [Flavobacteriales bacterium]|nr:hypothetical protein [Flavobacteriales bacterium]
MNESKKMINLPSRVKPALCIRDFIMPVVLISFYCGLIFAILPIVSASNFMLLFVVFFCGWVVKEVISLFEMFAVRNTFQLGQSRAVANILRRRVQDRRDVYNPHYTYLIQVSFLPTMAVNNDATVQYQLEVSGSQYNSLLYKKTVEITYAIKDPRIFILDGE